MQLDGIVGMSGISAMAMISNWWMELSNNNGTHSVFWVYYTFAFIQSEQIIFGNSRNVLNLQWKSADERVSCVGLCLSKTKRQRDISVGIKVKSKQLTKITIQNFYFHGCPSSFGFNQKKRSCMHNANVLYIYKIEIITFKTEFFECRSSVPSPTLWNLLVQRSLIACAGEIIRINSHKKVSDHPLKWRILTHHHFL